MLPLSSTKWVFFRVERGDELYVNSVLLVPGVGRQAEYSDNIREALGFGTASEAYAYGKKLAPTLDDWRVGLRAATRG